MCSDLKVFGGLTILLFRSFFAIATILRKPTFENVEDSDNLEIFLALNM